MHRTLTLTFALWIALSSSLSAQLPLNPLKWFAGDEEVAGLKLASSADQSAAEMLLEQGRDQMAAGKLRAAKSSFKKIIKDYPRAEVTPEAMFLTSRILMTQEKWGKAFDLMQEIVVKHPNYENFDRLIGAQFDCATAHMEGARGTILWIFPGFKQYGKAMTEFEQIVNNAPYSDYAPLSLMNIALVAQQEEKADEAIDSLDRLINYYPQSMLAPDAYYNLAETYSNLVAGSEYDQGSTRQAISYYEDFLVLFPQSSYIGEVEADLESMENLLSTSRLNLGDFYYYYQSNNTAALIFYNEAITIAPDSEAAAEAAARIDDIEAGIRPVNGATLLRKLLIID